MRFAKLAVLAAVLSAPAFALKHAAPEHNLKLTVTKGAANVVVSGQETLACQAAAACRWTWPAGASVTLTATAVTGYSLIAWKGCDTTDGTKCTVVLCSASITSTR